MLKKSILILNFFLFSLNIFGQTDSVLIDLQNYISIKTEKFNIISVKNRIDTFTYIKLIFDTPKVFFGEKKGIENITFEYIVEAFKEKYQEELQKNNITVSSNKFQITLKSNIQIDSLLLILDKFFVFDNSNKKLFDKIKNSEIKNTFPPFISPNTYIIRKTKNAFYENSNPEGEDFDLEKMKNISINDCEKFYAEYFLKSFKYFFVISNQSFNSQKNLALKYSNQFPDILINENKYKTSKLPQNTVIYFHETDEKITGSKTYMNILYPLQAGIGNKNYEKELIINKVLGEFQYGRFYSELFKHENYVDYVFLRHEFSPENPEFSVSVVLKPEYLAEILQIIINQQQKIISEIIPEAELEIAKEYCIRDFLKSLNSFDKIAEMIYLIEKYNLPEDYFSTLIFRLKKIGNEDIQKYASNYLRTDKYTIVILGKSKLIENQFLMLASIAETRTFKENSDIEIIPFGFNAMDIIALYLNKVGATKYPPEKPQTITITGKYVFEEFENKFERNIFRDGKKYLSETYLLNDNTNKAIISKKIVNSKNISSINYLDTIISDNDMNNENYSESFQFEELEYYQNKNISVELLGIVDEGENQLYKIFVKYPYDKFRYDYYDKKTYLKVKSEELKKETTKEGNNFKLINTVEISDYRQVPGDKDKMIPYIKIIKAKDFKIFMEVKSADLNAKFSSKIFDVN